MRWRTSGRQIRGHPGLCAGANHRVAYWRKSLTQGWKRKRGLRGYDLVRLITGSEGTLAVITAMTLRLVPKPQAKRTMIAFFPEVSLAVQTVSEMIRKKVVPAILEFMDRLCIDCVREEMHLDLPEDSGAMLLIEVDGDRALGGASGPNRR